MATTWKTRRISLGKADLATNSPGGTKLYFEACVNCEKAVNLVFFCNSKVDVPVAVQLFGAQNDAPRQPSQHYRIGNCFDVPAGELVSVPIALLLDNWHEYIGMECTTMRQSNVTGTITLSATIREQVDVVQDTVPQNYAAADRAPSIYSPAQSDRGAGVAPVSPSPRPTITVSNQRLWGGL